MPGINAGHQRGGHQRWERALNRRVPQGGRVGQRGGSAWISGHLRGASNKSPTAPIRCRRGQDEGTTHRRARAVKGAGRLHQTRPLVRLAPGHYPDARRLVRHAGLSPAKWARWDAVRMALHSSLSMLTAGPPPGRFTPRQAGLCLSRNFFVSCRNCKRSSWRSRLWVFSGCST